VATIIAIASTDHGMNISSKIKEACFERILSDSMYHPTVKKHIFDIWGKESAE
jgi:hypothetical protein